MIDFHSQLAIIPTVYESARLNDNVDGTGGITISWNAATSVVIPVGASVTYKGTKYSLLEPYTPTEGSSVHVRYEPTFLHPIARLSRVPFYISSREVGGESVDLYTSSFTGLPRTIAQKLCDFFDEYAAIDSEFEQTFMYKAGERIHWAYALGITNANSVITVDFDGCSIKAAATRIADALGCNMFFDWNARVIRFIVGSTISGDYYNCFRVLGGTTNMAKRTLSGVYAPVTQRLMLDETLYPGSIIVHGTPDIRLTTDLVFDDIYPKMELYVAGVRERLCFLTDENGERIPDTYTTVQGEQVVASYKTYSKWYVSLEYANGTQYIHDTGIQIADKPLCILFQPDYTNDQDDCPLAARQFEAVYFSAYTEEWEEDDALNDTTARPSTQAFVANAGEFRLIFTSEGDEILPTTLAKGVVPKVGNKVTLVNVAIENAQDVNYKAVAQQELLTSAVEVIDAMVNDTPDYTGTVIGDVPMLGESYTFSNAATGLSHSGVVTAVNADLDTGVSEVTVGTWRRKTLSGGIRDKIDSISVSTTGGDTGTTDTETSSISKTQFDALWKTTKKGAVNSEVINTLQADVAAIQAQSDAKFDIIFGNGTPTLLNEPAVTWIAEGTEAEHVGDIYYDINRAAASTGGRAWRWMFFEAGTYNVYVNGTLTTKTYSSDTYVWEEILDLDTRAALEKIRDVADDGILSAGSEKSQIYLEWRNAAELYYNTRSAAADANLSTAALDAAYLNLWKMLDGYDPDHSGTPAGYVYSTTPEWLSDLSVDTVLSEDNWTATRYRARWDAFYTALADLTGEQFTMVAGKISYFIGTSVPTPPYNAGDFWLKVANAGDTNGELYRCIVSVPSGGTASASHWVPATSIAVSITNVLAEIVSELEDYITEYQEDYPSVTSFDVYMQDTEPQSYDIWLDTSSPVSLDVFGTTISDTHIISLFLEAYGILGDKHLVIYKTTAFPASANKFDLYMRRSTFHDNFTNADIDGSLGVWVRSEQGWVKILDDTTGILQNYGDHIIMAVYGTSTVDGTRTDYASGITTASNYSQMFASAIDSASGASALAAIKTIIVYQNGQPTGAVKIDADDINFRGKTIALSANSGLTFSGGQITFNSSSTVNLNAATVNINAEQIAWKGTASASRSIITNTEGGETVVKFSVDGDGNVTMNNARMNSATVSGIIYATNLVLQNNAIIPSLYSEGVVSRQDGVYTKILAGKLEMGTYTVDSNNVITDVPKYRTSIDGNGKPVIEYLDNNGQAVQNTVTGDNTVIVTPSGSGNTYVVKRISDSWVSRKYYDVDNYSSGVTISELEVGSGENYYKYVEGYVVESDGSTETTTYNQSQSSSPSQYDGKLFTQMTVGSANYMPNGYYTGEVSSTTFEQEDTSRGIIYEYVTRTRDIYQVSSGTLTLVAQLTETTKTGRARITGGGDDVWEVDPDEGGEVIDLE